MLRNKGKDLTFAAVQNQESDHTSIKKLHFLKGALKSLEL